MVEAAKLQDLLQGRADLWRGGDPGALASNTVVPSGYPTLDRELAGGGWPRGALIEILSPHRGVGVLGLLLPALIRLSKEGRWIAWVAPPRIPYAPELAARGFELESLLWLKPPDAALGLWALEQSLRSQACSAVLGWVADEISLAQMRRLQLAAQASNALVVVFRSERCSRESLPAALRLLAVTTERGIRVEILKRRGGWASAPLDLEGGPFRASA